MIDSSQTNRQRERQCRVNQRALWERLCWRALHSILQCQKLRQHPSLFSAFWVPLEIFLMIISHAATLPHLGRLTWQMSSSDMLSPCCRLISEATAKSQTGCWVTLAFYCSTVLHVPHECVAWPHMDNYCRGILCSAGPCPAWRLFWSHSDFKGLLLHHLTMDPQAIWGGHFKPDDIIGLNW